MNGSAFAHCIHSEILQELLDSMTTYVSRHSEGDSAPLPGWPDAAQLASTLSPQQRELLVRTIRQAAIDAISGVLGVIDGSTLLRAHRGEFTLTYDGGSPINGELQTYFLAREEERQPR